MGDISINIMGEAEDVRTLLRLPADGLHRLTQSHIEAIDPEISTKDLQDARIGQYVMIELTDGRTARFGIVDRGDNWLRLDSHDCLGESPWNENRRNEGDIRLSDLQKYVDGLEELLPAEFRGAIIPTSRFTEEYEDEDGIMREDYMTRLFVPEASEVFAPNPNWYKTRNDQLDFYKDRRNRMKASKPGGTEMRYWWTASAGSGSATYCVSVSASGVSIYDHASNAYGVPVCFRINL